jgi:hypothetical protein
MHDYIFVDDEGRKMPVSEMTTDDIAICLNVGMELLGGESKEAIAKRLQLELEIRNGGLR